MERRLAARRRLALAILRGTWERRASAAALTWKDFRVTLDGWTVRREIQGKEIWEPVPEFITEEIRLFQTTCDLTSRPARDADIGRSLYWIGGKVGASGPITDATFYRDIGFLFELAARRANLTGRSQLASELDRPGRGPQTVRHTMATQFLKAGGRPEHAQEALGHAHVLYTLQTYTTGADAKRQTLRAQWNRSGRVDIGPGDP
jgi:integrase